MYSRWPFPPDLPGNGAAQDLVVIVTVVDVATWLVDGPVVGAVRDPRRAVCRPGQPDAARSDEVIHGLRVISDRVGDAAVVRAIGEVDLRNADGLAAALRAGWVAARPPGLLVVDLSGIVFISVAGLALLVATEQHCRERELELRVVATTRSVLRALRVTGLDALFAITPTLVAATRPRMNPEWTVRTKL
jgi:anti-sigma B factor antagonist